MTRPKTLQLIALEHLRDHVEANNSQLPATEHGSRLARATQKEIRNLELDLLRPPPRRGRPVRPDIDPAAVKRMAAAGTSLRAIAAVLECSHGTVRNILSRQV